MKKEELSQNEIVQDETENKNTARDILNVVVNVVLVLAIILAALCTYTSFVSASGNGVPSILGIRVFSIQTESMYPTLEPGDLIFGTGVKNPADLRRGDIITYWTVINGERVLNTHRIEEIYDGNGFLIFSTKGDKNTAVDALTVHESEIVAKYAEVRVKGLGKVFDYLQTSTGFLIVVVIPVFLFFLFHLVQFFRVLFEYQNVKNRIKYEQERGRTEDLILEQKRREEQAKAEARAAMEAELRERLKAELLASMTAQQESAQQPAEETPAEGAAEEVNAAAETSAEDTPAEETPVEETPAEETPAEETPAEETSEEEAPAEETPAEETSEEETPEEETSTEETPAKEVPEEEAAAPAVDEAVIEAMIAKQRAAIEEELRKKIMAEMMAAQSEEGAKK